MKINKEAGRDVFSAVLVIVISLAVYKTLGQLARNSLSNQYFAFFAAQLIFAIPVFSAVILLKKTDIYRSDPKKLKENWTAGILFLIMSFLSAVQIFVRGVRVTVGPVEIVLFILQMFLIGYCEETLYRGLLQNALHGLFGENSPSAVRIAVFITGILFGASHLLNAFNPEVGLAVAVFQSVGAAAMGWCMSAVYYRTGRCLWYLIALHAVNDGVVNIEQGVLSGVSEASAISSSTGSGLLYFAVPILFYGLVALFLLRRKKLEPLLKDGQ